MIAEFYIIAESFTQNNNSTSVEIESKIKLLAEDFVKIRTYKDTNKLFVHPDIYSVYFINGILLSDLLFNPEMAKKIFDRDVYNALQKIIIESATTSHTSREVIDVLLPEYNENVCHGLIAFNILTNVQPELQIVYNLQGWLKFRRHFLGIYPQKADFFMEECEKYFPRILFHENNRIKVADILPDFSLKIIYHLSSLNDRFKESKDGIRNRQQVLDHFYLNCHLDEHPSLEGDAIRKPKFTYEFISPKGVRKTICCEPHLKLSSSGKSGDNTYYYHRIYFHEGFPDFEDGKILVGHIGEHINFN